MIPDLNAVCFRLTNQHVQTALAGYPSSRTEILNFLLAEDAFDEPKQDPPDETNGPFGFDLHRVDSVRKTIKAIVAPRATRDGDRPSQINAFRRELILATADAVRRDAVALTLHLYTALMEAHAALAQDPNSAALTTEIGGASAAGRRLLQCLVVQAAYDNLGAYRFVLEQFARVVAAIRLPLNKDHGHLCERLLNLSAMPLDMIETELRKSMPTPLSERTPLANERWRLMAVVCGAQAHAGYEGDLLLRQAREFGAALGNADASEKAPRWVVVLKGQANEKGRSIGAQIRLGVTDAGGRVIEVATARKARWTSTGQVLSLMGPAALGTSEKLGCADDSMRFPEDAVDKILVDKKVKEAGRVSSPIALDPALKFAPDLVAALTLFATAPDDSRC